jgi:hypothetical protein
MTGFQKAERKKSKLRLALTGPAGAGKTYSALLIAKGIGGKIAVVDTEKGSASLYADLVPFDVLELQAPYTPERFIEAVDMAAKAGYEILIIDSITHEWSGVGGCLELVDEISRAKYRGNSWSAWNDVTPRHRDFLDALTQSPMHIIATMRSKTETVQTEENGKKKVSKIGMKAEQREGAEYEFTLVLDIVHDGHFAVASKDRTGLFVDKDPKPITPETGKMVFDWLNAGHDTVAPPKTAPKAEPKKAEQAKKTAPQNGPPPDSGIDYQKEDAFPDETTAEPPAKQEEPPAPKKTTNYEFLKQLKPLKEFLGDDEYYGILGSMSYEHADEIVKREDQVAFYKALVAAKKERAA